MANPRRIPQETRVWTRTDDSPGNIFMRKLTLQSLGGYGVVVMVVVVVELGDFPQWKELGVVGFAVSLPLHYIKFIPNLRAAGKHFICLGWLCSTLAYQILLAGQQIVQQQQLQQEERQPPH